jgi:hypothetical protein
MQNNNNNVSRYFFENFKGGRGGGNKNTKGNSTIYLIIFTVFTYVFIYFINILFSKSKKL